MSRNISGPPEGGHYTGPPKGGHYVLFAAALCLAASTAFAQAVQPSQSAQSSASVDSRWLPWFGCWRPSEQRAPEEGAHVCVVPAGTIGARMITLAGDQKIVEETVTPDASEHATTEPGCRGSRRAEWSRDGERLFSSATLACDNEPARSVSGITLMSSQSEWIDIQVVTVAGRESVRVRRYRRSGERPPEGGELSRELLDRAERTLTLSQLSTDDIIEANGKVSSKAIEAALLETSATFRLDSRTLVAMDDAGVPDGVIDLMVALSYPKRFEVKRSSRSSSSSSTFWPGVGFSNFDWYGFDPFYSYYAYYSPFNSRYDPFGYYYYGPGTGVIADSPGSSDQTGPHGRVVNGGGYTQVSPRAPEASAHRGSSGDANSGPSSAGSSDGGSSTATSGGYSSGGGGGGGDGGHSAVPR